MNRIARRLAVVAGVAVLGVGTAATADAATTVSTFSLVRSGVAQKAGCLSSASAKVTVHAAGPVEIMSVDVKGLPKNTDYDLFITQSPDAPFGLSWYQSDLHVGRDGKGSVTVIGRFNQETFTVAPGAVPAPKVHAGDAVTNPATGPVHQFHVGLWFNSPADAAKAGCPTAVTPFNGEHNAGVQALSSRQFPVTAGPLSRIVP